MDSKTVWLIERLDRNGNTDAYLWAEPEGKFWWVPVVQDTNHGALRFARQRDAFSFLHAMIQLEQNLPYKDTLIATFAATELIRVAEHQWI